MEGINQIATKELISLSEQELVDCDMCIVKDVVMVSWTMLFQFIIKIGGIDTDKDCPCVGKDRTCDLTSKNAGVVSIDGYENVPVIL